MKQLRLLIGLVMFTGLLKLFGCSEPKKQESGLSKEMQDQIDQSIEAFKNRPIHTELTTKIIDGTSNEDLLQVIFDNLSAKLPSDHEKEYKTVMTWNKSRQAIYMIWLLDVEVNNGGYNQFYFNPSGQFYRHLPNALKLIGANQFAELTQKANTIYEKENKKITKDQDRTLEGFSKSYKNNPLNNFDDKFYNLNSNEILQKIQVDYIRKNKSEFIDK